MSRMRAPTLSNHAPLDKIVLRKYLYHLAAYLLLNNDSSIQRLEGANIFSKYIFEKLKLIG